MKLTLPLGLSLALLAALAWRAVDLYPELPEQMASHFAGDGTADGFQSKPAFFGLMGAVLALMALVTFGLPLLFARIPVAWFNLPNRDHWLAPERAEETRTSVRSFLAWFGLATLLLIAAVLEMVYAANLSGTNRLEGPFGWILGAYLGFVIAWMVLFYRRFARRS